MSAGNQPQFTHKSHGVHLRLERRHKAKISAATETAKRIRCRLGVARSRGGRLRVRRIIGVALSKNDHLADAFKEIRGYQ